MLAPIIPHTCEEAYGFFKLPHKQESIFLHEHEFDLHLEGIKPIEYER
jgi:isoleucyl-tRNA synthetase